MRESLLIHVGESPNQPINWLVYNAAEDEIIGSGQIKDAEHLNELSEKAQSRECTLVLPSAQVQLHTVTLPTKWNRKLAQALPFMIEEQVAVDIDSLFIAHGDAFSEEDKHFMNIALVDKQWLQAWLDVCDQVDIMPTQVHVDALLLPEPQTQSASAIALSDDSFLVRYGNWRAAQLEPNWAGQFLHAANIGALDLYSPLPVDLEDVELRSHEDKFELPLAMFAKAASALNLRQGPFVYKKKSSGWIKIWRPAITAAVITLVFMFSVKGAQWYYYTQQAQSLQTQVVSTYERAFPGTKVRPHLLRSQINKALGDTGQSDSVNFLGMLQDFSDIVQQSEEFVTQTLRFDQRRNELRVGARAKDFQSFAQVKSRLEQRGFEVEQGSLNNDGESVVGELRIKGAQ
ncbi:type II secretion system protein GspL [Pseudoalteromonas sp. SSDWG2]|uniref:type II secretion system protein GspL n=1 Tax=Pseudoalteromonas sp. SSDWG2 TaxID=3139391 RepID=UPI003BAD4B6F